MANPGAETISGTNSRALGLSLKCSMMEGKAGNIEMMAKIGRNAVRTIIIPCGINVRRLCIPSIGCIASFQMINCAVAFDLGPGLGRLERGSALVAVISSAVVIVCF